MSRSSTVRNEKQKAVANGHDMGNVVNVAPFNASADWTVRSTCKRCGKHLFVEGKPAKSWGPALDQKCLKTPATVANSKKEG